MPHRKPFLVSRVVGFLAVFALAHAQASQGQQNAQNQDTGAYATLMAQAKADLNSGDAAKALNEAEQAEKLDPKPWGAYVVAGAAQELQKAYGAAVESFTQAINNAPEDKKAAINDLLQKCIQRTQQAVPQPPNPNASTNGPILEEVKRETMQFIELKMKNQGTVGWYYTSALRPDENSGNKTDLVTDVTTDPASCTFSVTHGEKDSGSFKDVKTVVVGAYTGLNPGDRVAPTIFLVQLQAEGNVFTISPRWPFQPQKTNVVSFFFRDKDTAEQVAKAIAHAAELCGGGSKPEPF